MKNVTLVQGKCPVCGSSISKKWAGENPTIGTVCENCFYRKDELFGPDNVELSVQKTVVFMPLFDKYEYHFDWRGTRVMINGKVGVVQDTCLGSCHVKFPGGREWGDSISTLDYWLLKDIYEKTGGEMEPPPLDFEPHVPSKAPLLEKPVLSVEVTDDGNGNVRSIKVGNRSISGGIMGRGAELPVLPMLHAFCNLFVRYKFGLTPNFACEGGFYGRNFEVRNAGGFIGGCGLNISMHSVGNERNLAGVMELMHGLTAVKHSGVVENADANEVLATWVKVMETLLRYDWTQHQFDTIEDVWKGYCVMQDLLANILEPDDLSATLEFAKAGEMKHAGSSY